MPFKLNNYLLQVDMCQYSQICITGPRETAVKNGL